MKKIWKLVLLALAVNMLGTTTISAQEFSDIRTRQLGQNVNVEYSIVGEQLGQVFNIQPSYSLDGGRSFRPMKSVTGFAGKSVSGGKNQVIIWNVLNDLPELDGEVVFKLTGNTQTTKPLEDDFNNVSFKLISLHRVGNNQLELNLSITNNGPARDLKLINGLITITDFNRRSFDAQRGKLGEVVGSQRHSTPQRTLKTGETVEATFTFDRIPDDFDRVMRLRIGAELLTFSRFGLDNLDISALQFRDFPISDKPTSTMTATTTRQFEATSTARFNIKKPALVETKKDNTPPVISVLKPEGVPLFDAEATRGRPLAHSSSGLEDRRLRSISAEDAITVTDSELFVKGTATDESGIFEVVVNGRNATLKPDGFFEVTVPLRLGRNDIVIRSMDIFENSSERKFVVIRTDASGKTVSSGTEELDIVFDAPRAPRYYALIIGVNEYPDEGIATLANPIRDAARLAKTLVDNYTFEARDIVFLQNPTRAEIIDALDNITRRVTQNDNLLIFFAGHGYFDTQTEFGYWLPADSRISSTANWIANSQLKDYIAAIKSRHTLLIADACFSGGIFKTRKAFSEAPEEVNSLFDRKSRKAMTSGALTEVPDESVFLRHLVQRLQENTLGYLSAEELFSSFRTAVMNSSPTIPLYGDVKGTGDEGGDFVFVRR